jgi:hypothetical protein
MDSSMMAGGQPQQPAQPQPQIAPGGAVSGVDPQKIQQALEMIISQTVNAQGYVDMDKVVAMWPQVSQQLGLNIPFQTVMQMIQNDPSLVENIIQQKGLAGIIVKGKMISAQELEKQASAGGGGSQPPQQGVGGATGSAQMAGGG